ncbi:hypothetical protein L227DRAFT_558657 [Lentinus tigrinus ALCF2SS1-6]|uniref:Wax synthase domain-containing protein n=2 Tax=Lentinus tigrinus TaxID=5365 RepID=A0A5C2RMZ0_9APHY|nr:hypothetical protein L227DRAFT_558657 [Lentinus tigrinus ALCF2SS1-6]
MADAKTLPEPRVPFNALTHLLLPEIALAVLMAVRLPFVLKAAISCVFLGSILHIVLTTSTGSVSADYAVGCSGFGTLFFNVLLFVWIVDPMDGFRHVRDPDGTPLATRSLLARVYNAACIVRNYRLVGWNVQASKVAHSSKATRSQFLPHRFRQFLWSFLFVDLVESYVYSHHHLYAAAPGGPPMWEGLSGFVLRSWVLLVWGMMIYATLKMCYEITSLLAVGLGCSHPQDWPDMFGHFSDAYTVRRLWGRTWHQILGRHFSSWGKLVVRALGIPRGTWLSSQTQVYTAFFISALYHSFGDVMIDKRHFGRSFPFFMSNALAITFEDTVIALAKSCGVAAWGKEGSPCALAMKLLGYAWVVLWLRFSGPMFVDWMYEAGVVEGPVLPLSPVRSLLVPLIYRIIKL